MLLRKYLQVNGQKLQLFRIFSGLKILQLHNFCLLDQCFAAECKDCAANPDDSTTCGESKTHTFYSVTTYLIIFSIDLIKRVGKISSFDTMPYYSANLYLF